MKMIYFFAGMDRLLAHVKESCALLWNLVPRLIRSSRYTRAFAEGRICTKEDIPVTVISTIGTKFLYAALLIGWWEGLNTISNHFDI